MGSSHSSFKPLAHTSVLVPPRKLIVKSQHLHSCFLNPEPSEQLLRTSDNPNLLQQRLIMSTYRTSEDSLTNFLSTFNQVFLGYIFLAVVLSISMGGVLVDSSASDPLVHDDYNFEIKTAMERTKNHAA